MRRGTWKNGIATTVVGVDEPAAIVHSPSGQRIASRPSLPAAGSERPGVSIRTRGVSPGVKVASPACRSPLVGVVYSYQSEIVIPPGPQVAPFPWTGTATGTPPGSVNV